MYFICIHHMYTEGHLKIFKYTEDLIFDDIVTTTGKVNLNILSCYLNYFLDVCSF